MENSLILLITLYFVIVFICHISKVRRFDSVCFIYALWILSSLAGFLYANSSIVYQGRGKMTIYSVVFLISMYHLTMTPINHIKTLNVSNYKIIKTPILTYATYILALSSILPFCENVLHIVMGHGMSAMGDLYNERTESLNFDFRSHMSWLGARLNSVTILFKYITPLVFINYLIAISVKKKWVIIGLLMGIFNPAISMFYMGSRWVAIEDTIFTIFLFLLHYDLFPVKIKKNVIFAIGAIASFVLVGVGYITFGRFADSEFSLTEWLYRYTGEGFYNFATDLWYVDNHSEGMHLFRGFYENAIEKLNRVMGIRMYVFYTYIGDFYADWGIFITIIICLFINKFASKIIRAKSQNIYSVFILCMYCKIFLTGFTYIVFINTMLNVLIAFIFFLICDANQINYKSKRSTPPNG